MNHISSYLDSNKELLVIFTDFLRNVSDFEKKIYSFYSFIKTHKIKKDKNELRLMLHTLVTILNNHHRNEGFNDKAIRILSCYRKQINNFFQILKYLIFLKIPN